MRIILLICEKKPSLISGTNESIMHLQIITNKIFFKVNLTREKGGKGTDNRKKKINQIYTLRRFYPRVNYILRFTVTSNFFF